MRNWKFRLLFILMCFSTVGCGNSLTAGDSNAPTTPKLYGGIGSEKAYCSNVSSPSTYTTITSTAQYKYRTVNSAIGLTTSPTTPGNIRHAEVQVLDSNGTTVQCGETDSSGNISVRIPKTAGTYTLKVLSRADNSYLKASILNNSTAMEPYSISSSFTLTGSETSLAVTLTPADYRNTLEGGAFNILDQLYNANEYLRTNSTFSGCTFCNTFTVAPKVRVFWTPGLSPGAYYDSPTSAISFYIGDDDTSLGMASGMYIMGGINGSVCVDTDHFDNSVLIHEYGHFLEKAYAYSDSPGGSHNGNGIIDPRLAWSEGWSNFLQGAVRGDSHYVDTTGNIDCSSGTGIAVNLDLENITNGQDAVSGSTYLGEGIFREVSVSRVLWDTMTSKVGGDSYGAGVGFSYIWKVFSDSSSGFRSSSVHFRNVGHFNEFMRSLINTNSNASLTDFDNLVSHERQRSDRLEYAYPLRPQAGATCTFDLQGVAGVDNMAKTNDYLAYYYDGSAAHATITMKYAAASSGTPSNLDLYAWNEDYVDGDMSTAASVSARSYPENGSSGVETISLAGHPAGYYMLNIYSDPSHAGSLARYYLETNGGSERLCP